MRLPARLRATAALAALPLLGLAAAPSAQAATVRQLPTNGTFDYQIGGDYTPASGVDIVSRDWSSGQPLGGDSYSICYVNAFQTQDDGDGSRIDEQSQWPQDVVLTELGDDPNWGGEYLIDLSTWSTRNKAARWVAQMTDTCASKGFDAVEFDNLDSWTRFDGTDGEGQVPFGKKQALQYAKVLTDHAHSKGLAVAQKNTAEIGKGGAEWVGFDFAIVEQCGEYSECSVFTWMYGAKVIAVEYTDEGFAAACKRIGSWTAVVKRDVSVSPNGVFETC